jgi:hypothetical protein
MFTATALISIGAQGKLRFRIIFEVFFESARKGTQGILLAA